ncbi:hypothetical protein JOF55_001737 [Haloactinomyces albus]|uniref:Uncharacterized protein n=1 Tax=Haloactinomyces albus TaxID=1352928 RepID=A0AAE4CLP8_9ACTN|nr:hypothetical protein [Haloactinomyces albus]
MAVGPERPKLGRRFVSSRAGSRYVPGKQVRGGTGTPEVPVPPRTHGRQAPPRWHLATSPGWVRAPPDGTRTRCVHPSLVGKQDEEVGDNGEMSLLHGLLRVFQCN